jgi:phospho-N-acetylmuramoyl-pentapeptide-transferase
VHRNPKGLSARSKFFWQSLFGLGAAAYLGWMAQTTPALNELIVPFFKFVAYPLGALGFVVLSYFVIVGTSNAVNLTDGLDGPGDHAHGRWWAARSASSPTSPATRCSPSTLACPYVAGAGELAVFCGAPGRRRAWASSGSTPIRRKCSWATSARSRWAPRSAPSP